MRQAFRLTHLLPRRIEVCTRGIRGPAGHSVVRETNSKRLRLYGNIYPRTFLNRSVLYMLGPPQHTWIVYQITENSRGASTQRQTDNSKTAAHQGHCYRKRLQVQTKTASVRLLVATSYWIERGQRVWGRHANKTACWYQPQNTPCLLLNWSGYTENT